MRVNDPYKFRDHLILSGDRGDGVPNVLSPDASIVEGIRQKPLRESKIDRSPAISVIDVTEAFAATCVPFR